MQTDSWLGLCREPGLREAPPFEIGSSSLSQANWGGPTGGGFEGRTFEVEEGPVRQGGTCCPCEVTKCNLST